MKDGTKLRIEKLIKRNTKHGYAKRGMEIPEYKAWSSMRQRCRRPKDQEYKNYGGRGIDYCSSWESFKNFFNDMGKKPSPTHSLDRIDVNGNYCPENCRWATPKTQANNTTRNRYLTAYGVKLTMAQWAETLEIPQARIKGRLRIGWSDHDALFTQKRSCKKITINGVSLTIQEWAKKINVSQKLIYGRIRSGWSERDAILKEKQINQFG